MVVYAYMGLASAKHHLIEVGPQKVLNDATFSKETITRSRWLALSKLRRRRYRRHRIRGRWCFLLTTGAAALGSARVAVWPSMVGALCPHRRGSMARLAQARLPRRALRAEALRHTTTRQRTLDLAVLRVALWRHLVCRDCCSMVAHRQHNRRVLAIAPGRRSHAGAVLGLGQLRVCIDLLRMAAKPCSSRLGVPRPGPDPLSTLSEEDSLSATGRLPATPGFVAVVSPDVCTGFSTKIIMKATLYGAFAK